MTKLVKSIFPKVTSFYNERRRRLKFCTKARYADHILRFFRSDDVTITSDTSKILFGLFLRGGATKQKIVALSVIRITSNSVVAI